MPFSTATSDAGSELLDFDTDGEWDGVEGPAVHAPDHVRNIVLGQKFRIEFLDISDPSDNFYAKHHIVSSVPFAESLRVAGTEYKAARVSMELGPSTPADVGPGYVAGDDYHPGKFNIKLLEYLTSSYRSVECRTFNLKDSLTIGELIDAAILQRMHHFLFLPYTSEGRWKGCGDFMLQYWAVLVRAGMITSPESEENPEGSLSTDLTITYLPGRGQTSEEVGRGWWLRWNPVDDALSPEYAYSDRRPTYMLSTNHGGGSSSGNVIGI